MDTLNKSDICTIVASGKPNVFKRWMDTSFKVLSEHRIILTPFGETPDIIESIAATAGSSIEICEKPKLSGFENNRNNAIKYMMLGDKPNYVVFIDDDTFLHKKWLESMLFESKQYDKIDMFSSRVCSSDSENILQGAGHFFSSFSPRFLWDANINDNLTPLCPCGNSAFIKWDAIEKILNEGHELWDSKFDQWQTCFDFGLKLRLINNSQCKYVQKAKALHLGYPSGNDNISKEDAKKTTHKQLRSRILLYKKFLPTDMYDKAMRNLESRLEVWIVEGYTDFKEHVFGDELNSIFASAKKDAEILFNQKSDYFWIEKASERNDLNKIFGLIQ